MKLGTTVGGDFMLLASAEYLLPVTADDALRMVFFVDSGTVEESVELDSDTYRVAAGFGLRISVPGMGPAPIALDFAWPINKADFDDTRAIEHDNEIGHAYRREPVGNQDRDTPAAAHRGCVALEKRVLGLGVERGRRLVEHEQ